MAASVGDPSPPAQTPMKSAERRAATLPAGSSSPRSGSTPTLVAKRVNLQEFQLARNTNATKPPGGGLVLHHPARDEKPLNRRASSQ
jgi:hypothetical protein